MLLRSEMNNIQPIMSRGRAMGRISGYSMHLCVSTGLPSLRGTLGHLKGTFVMVPLSRTLWAW